MTTTTFKIFQPEAYTVFIINYIEGCEGDVEMLKEAFNRYRPKYRVHVVPPSAKKDIRTLVAFAKEATALHVEGDAIMVFFYGYGIAGKVYLGDRTESINYPGLCHIFPRNKYITPLVIFTSVCFEAACMGMTHYTYPMDFADEAHHAHLKIRGGEAAARSNGYRLTKSFIEELRILPGSSSVDIYKFLRLLYVRFDACPDDATVYSHFGYMRYGVSKDLWFLR